MRPAACHNRRPHACWTKHGQLTTPAVWWREFEQLNHQRHQLGAEAAGFSFASSSSLASRDGGHRGQFSIPHNSRTSACHQSLDMRARCLCPQLWASRPAAMITALAERQTQHGSGCLDVGARWTFSSTTTEAAFLPEPGALVPWWARPSACHDHGRGLSYALGQRRVLGRSRPAHQHLLCGLRL